MLYSTYTDNHQLHSLAAIDGAAMGGVPDYGQHSALDSDDDADNKPKQEDTISISSTDLCRSTASEDRCVSFVEGENAHVPHASPRASATDRHDGAAMGGVPDYDQHTALDSDDDADNSSNQEDTISISSMDACYSTASKDTIHSP